MSLTRDIFLWILIKILNIDSTISLQLETVNFYSNKKFSRNFLNHTLQHCC